MASKAGTSSDDQADSRPICVICGLRTQTEKYRPFCCKRCSDIDLHRWLGGVYAIPGKDEEEEDEAPTAPRDSKGDR